VAARIDFRLSDGEKLALQQMADAEGKSLSQLIKERVLGASSSLDERLEAVESRLSRLEEMAGL
jgi:uncharacterized protein (DUF1778 family)